MTTSYDTKIIVRLPLKCGWIIQGVYSSAGSMQVKLSCHYILKGWNQDLYLNLDSGTFAGPVFPPLSTEDPAKMARQVREAILKTLPAQIEKHAQTLAVLEQHKKEITALHNQKWQEETARKNKNPPSAPPRGKKAKPGL